MGRLKSRATFLRIIAANLSCILMAQELPSLWEGLGVGPNNATV